MKKILLPIVLLLCLLLCACGELEPWEMPVLDAAPTPSPMPSPKPSGQPVSYLWNQASSYDMADPGVTTARFPTKLSHKETLALFGQDLLPSQLFSESYSRYEPLYLQKAEHDVILDAEGQLAENAYVEFHYLPSKGDEKKGLTVMVELCSHETVDKLSNEGYLPHVHLAEDSSFVYSSYYLERFSLFKVGSQRWAQALVLPDGYISKAASALAKAQALEEQGKQAPPLPRQALLSFTCGEEMSDQQFIEAVCKLWQSGSGIDPDPPKATPAPGEKGAA